MSLPVGVSSFTLNFGPYTNAQGLADLVASGGKLFAVDPSTNRPIRLVHVATGQVLTPTPIPITVASNGTASVAGIPHTGQAGLSPTGYAWRVEWNIASRKPSPGNLTFVVDSGATADFDLLVPAETVPAVAISQPTVATVNGLMGNVVLDADDVNAVAVGAGAGGALSGTYPNPGLNVSSVVSAVEGADDITPTGTWDFTGATVTGVGGAVDSVNAKTGAVVLNRVDVGIPFTGNVVNWIGDSIAPPIRTYSGVDTVNGLGVLLTPGDFLAWAHLLSSAQILFGKVAGVSGERADQINTRIITDALSHGGQFCGINTMTNDASQGRTPAQYAADIRSMCAKIVAAGMTPILTTGVPNPATGSGATQSRLLADRYRRFTIAYAIQNGWPLVDTYSLLVDPATGGYLSAYDIGDGTHPNPAGKKLMGQALADAMASYLAPLKVAPAAWDTAAQIANLVPNPLFKTDTNADGTPDSWTKTGTLTVSTGTDAAVKGKYLRIQETASAGFAQVAASPTITGLAGNAIAVSGLFKVVGTSQVSLTISTSGAATNLNLRPISAWTEPTGDWRTFYLQAKIPTGATSMSINFNTNGGTSVDAYIAQVGIYDLTTSGF